MAFEDAEQETVEYIGSAAAESEVALEEAVATLARQDKLGVRSPAHRDLLITNRAEYRSPVLAMSLLAEARTTWHKSPAHAQEQVEAVFKLLREAREAECPELLRGVLMTRAWTYSANVQRIRGDLHLADQHLKNAQAISASAAFVDQQGQVELLWHEAALRRDQGRLTEAEGLLQEALQIGRRANLSTVLLGQLTLSLAILYQHQEQLDKAIQLLEDLLPRLSPAHSALFLIASQSLAVFYARAGQPTEARRRLPDIRSRAARIGHEIHLLRVNWLEGLINAAEGNRGVAQAFFRLVQKGFVEAGYPLNAALVSLDWAALLLEHGDTAAAGELACEMLPIFEALEIEREVLMSLRLLTESLRRQAASVADVKDAARELGLARRVRKPAG